MRKGPVVFGVAIALAVVVVATVVWRALPGEGEPLLDSGEAQALRAADVRVGDGGIAPLRLGRDVVDVAADGWLAFTQDDGCTRIEPPPSGAGPVSAQVDDGTFHGVLVQPEGARVQLMAWAVDGEVVTSQAALISAEPEPTTGDGVALGVPWSNVEGLGEVETLTVSTPSGEAVDVRVVRWQDGGVGYGAADLGGDVVAWLEVADADAPTCELDEAGWARVGALDLDPAEQLIPFGGTGPVDLGVLGRPVADLGVELEPLGHPSEGGCQITTPPQDPETAPRVEYLVKDGVVIGMWVYDGAVVPGLATGEPLDTETAGLTVSPSSEQSGADNVTIVGTLPGDVAVFINATVESADLPELDSRAILGSPVPLAINVGVVGC